MRSLSLAGLAAGVLLHLAPAAGAEEVWYAARGLERGDTLREADLRAAEPASARRVGLVPTERVITGLEVKRRIAVGAPILDRDIGERDLVQANQPVRVFWKAGGITLELQGRAMEAGPLGAEVRVHNPSSGRTIRATVVAEGTAEIRGEP